MTIYLDCNATTPIDPEVMRIVRHYMEVEFGNAGSRTHEYGLRAKQAVERAREQVAAVVNAKPDEVIFTSGATESNNLALLGLEEEGRRSGRMHIISTQIEHKAVLEPLDEMRKRGFEVTLLPPTRDGWVNPAAVQDALREDTLLVSVMHVNNETGVIQPLSEICAVLSRHLAYLHVDAAQGFCKAPGLESHRIDLTSISGHKIFGPKGIGALVGRRRQWIRVPLRAILFGGGQESGLRAGTTPVPLVAGLGLAAERAAHQVKERQIDCHAFKNILLGALRGLGAEPVGDQKLVLASTLAVSFPHLDSEAAMLALKNCVALSNGAACTSHSYDESHVLRAMGVSPRGFLRFSWCGSEPHECVMRIEEALKGIVANLRNSSN